MDEAVVMYDHDNKRPRGFGFVSFFNEESVEAVFTSGVMQMLHDKPIEIKRAVPRDQMPITPVAAGRGRQCLLPTLLPACTIKLLSRLCTVCPTAAMRCIWCSVGMVTAAMIVILMHSRWGLVLGMFNLLLY